MTAATGRLDPDAMAVARSLSRILPRPFHELGVADSRAVAADLRPRGEPEPIHEVRDSEIPGRNGLVPIRLYRPQGAVELPVAIYFHGGGWTVGSLDGVDAVCRAIANRSGCVVVSVDYRLAPEHKYPTPLHDCVDAVAHLALRGAELGVDGTRIGLVGDSAGGNLAAAVALWARDTVLLKLRCQVLVYPATEFAVDRPSWSEHADGPLITTADVMWFWGNYLRDEGDRRDPFAVPAAAASLAGLPRTLVITAAVDPLRDSAEAFAARLLADGVDASASRYDGVFHGFFTEIGTFRATDAAVSEAARFLRNSLLP
ncbi:alpha/beta hydrolase [Pseudonocardia sp. GCM10023141]|uniref:alpha/beta hydrolase n=1 Tax=Pseudonocardia sp. GCM10023141 TaxID=3252653 RepID=UPI0036216112